MIGGCGALIQRAHAVRHIREPDSPAEMDRIYAGFQKPENAAGSGSWTAFGRRRGLGMETRLRGEPLARADGAVSPSTWSHASAPAARAAATAERIPLAATVAIFALAFLVPAWPWLSGTVTIPWDAKSQFFPSVQFLAS